MSGRKIILVLAVVLSQPVFARDAEEGLRLCDSALTACEEQRKASDELHKEKDKALEFYRNENERLRKSKDSIFNNPYLYLTVGIIAGALISK